MIQTSEREDHVTAWSVLRLTSGVLVGLVAFACFATLVLAPLGLFLFLLGAWIAGEPLKALMATGEARQRSASTRAYVMDQQRALSVGLLDWTRAGEISIGDSGALEGPEMPGSAGLRRLDFVGPAEGQLAVSFAQSGNLRDSLDLADPLLLAHLAAGGTVEVSYLDHVPIAAGELDLTSAENRQALIDVIQRQAVSSGAWDVG